MEERPSRTYSWKIVASFLVVGFFIGQLAPAVLPNVKRAGNQLDFSDLQSTYDILERKFDGDLDRAKMLESARAGLVAGTGDPHTTFLNAEAAAELNDQLNGSLSGIGAEIAIKNNKLTVVAPVAESPAAKAGLQPGDWITQINDTDSSALTLDEAVKNIRGEKGTQVRLTIIRGATQPKELTITRDRITVPSVRWSIKEGGIGYIQITQFGTDTPQKIKQAATELKTQGATKIILDMRNNSGGFLDAAVDVSSQFLPSDKVVVEERRRGKTVDKLKTDGGGVLVGLPLVVLINEGSASASEIVAGAIKDHGAGKLLGEKSFGKGSVQEVIKLGGGAELKVTVAHWFTPNGTGIDREGIKPDIEVKQGAEEFNTDRDPQLERALQELRNQ